MMGRGCPIPGAAVSPDHGSVPHRDTERLFLPVWINPSAGEEQGTTSGDMDELQRAGAMGAHERQAQLRLQCNLCSD